MSSRWDLWEKARVKEKIYMKDGIQSSEMILLTKRQEAKSEVVELKILRFSSGVTRMDTIRKRRNGEYSKQRMLKMSCQS